LYRKYSYTSTARKLKWERFKQKEIFFSLPLRRGKEKGQKHVITFLLKLLDIIV